MPSCSPEQKRHATALCKATMEASRNFGPSWGPTYYIDASDKESNIGPLGNLPLRMSLVLFEKANISLDSGYSCQGLLQ